MTTIRPAVQREVGRASRYIVYDAKERREDKRNANRAHRRYLEMVVRSFERDPELFESEDFGAPTLSSWDVW